MDINTCIKKYGNRIPEIHNFVVKNVLIYKKVQLGDSSEDWIIAFDNYFNRKDYIDNLLMIHSMAQELIKANKAPIFTKTNELYYWFKYGLDKFWKDKGRKIPELLQYSDSKFELMREDVEF